MKFRAKALLIVSICLPAALLPGHTGASGLPTASPQAVYSAPAGEELLYEVSWWIVKLGTIRMRVVNAVRDSGGERSTVRADVDTYEGLPFASLHAVSETVMDNACYSLSSIGINQDGDVWRTIRYDYVPERSRLFIERGTTPDRKSREFSTEKVDTLNIDTPFQDGLSIFYYARANLVSKEETSVRTVVEGTDGKTLFRYPGERTSEEIGAVDYPIDVIGFQGVAVFNGIYGLTGDFEGWFSNDDARVPIRANMGLTLGSVKIELIGWRRDGWTPPRHTED
jgi:hypothetical protein